MRARPVIGGVFAFVVLGLGLAAMYPVVTPRTDAPAAEARNWACDARFGEDVARYVEPRAGIDAFVLMRGTELVHSQGPVDLPINTHSVRKSILSLLYGIAQAQGLIDVRSTLRHLQIDDDRSALTASERKARVRDLLKSRSGIYIEAAGETAAMKAGRPQRGAFPPGKHFYYNNWDFNVLGVILERATGRGIGTLIDEWLAKPTGMQDFLPEHVIYQDAEFSEHRQFVVFMSARDLARLGALFLTDGRWGETQVVPSAWLDESTTRYSEVEVGPYDGYGYLWWIDEDFDTVWADGWGGQYLLIDRANELVMVSRNDTGRRLGEIFHFRQFGTSASPSDMQMLYERVLAALADAC